MTPAPTCPDCGSTCVHPLTMPVECDCGADPSNVFEIVRPPCEKCRGTGKVAQPLPTDEQIFGRVCEKCDTEKRLGAYFRGVPSSTQAIDLITGKIQDGRPDCPNCAGIGRIGAAKNEWICLGTIANSCGACDGSGKLRGHACPSCRGTGKEHSVERSPGYFESSSPCPGRTDVQADPTTWANAIRAWRTRTKTTVLSSILHSWDRELMVAQELLPPGTCGPGLWGWSGRWTIVVMFEPESRVP